MTISTAERLAPIPMDDYLAGEQQARRKHEYVDGMIYAMVEGRYAHNLIASNILAEFHSQLKGKPCRALNSDSKIRTQAESRTRFYYPDVSVIYGDNLRSGLFQDKPSIVVEVLSASTRRIDLGEKQDVYLSIETLSAYIMFEQDFAAAMVMHREHDTFVRRTYDGLSSVIELPGIDVSLPLAAAYAEVTFTPEPDLSDESPPT